MAFPSDGSGSSQPEAIGHGVICGGPGVVRFPWPNSKCPVVHTPFGDLHTHVLTDAELAKPDAPTDVSKEIGSVSGTAGAVAPAAQGPTGIGFFDLGDVLDSLGRLLKAVQSPDFWKGAGLLLAAGVVVVVGGVLWLGKGKDVEVATERAVL